MPDGRRIRGAGKTRLIQQVAAKLARDPIAPFPEGIWFVPLATIVDADRVPVAIARVLGLELGDEFRADAIIEFLRERESMLILDNVEQIIEIASFVSRISTECRDVKIIVTSRRPLRISGEQEFALAPLQLPENNDELPSNPAVALFLRRARMVNPVVEFDDRTLQAVAGICRGLDGLPLAIELAASRVKALSPTVLASQLNNRPRLLTGGPRDAPARQQTLQSPIAWSYDILAPEEKMLFRRLSVFDGGFSLDAAERLVAKFDPSPDSGVGNSCEIIATLVDHSLLHATSADADKPRWSMLQTIREFGLEQRMSSGEGPDIWRLHAEVTAKIAAGADPGMYGVDQPVWIRRLTADDGNIWAAVSWSVEHGERDLALKIAGPLWRYRSFRHLGNEGRSWLKKALVMPGEATDLHLGMGFHGAGCLAEDIGDYPTAERLHRQALEIWRKTGDQFRMARTLDDLGNVAHDQGAFESAIDLHNQAFELAKASGNRRTMASAMSNLGAAAYLQGDL